MPTVQRTGCGIVAVFVAFGAGAVQVKADPASVLSIGMPVAEGSSAPGKHAFRIIGMRTDAVVRLIADHHGLVPHVSDRVQGNVSDIRLEGDITAMMNTLAEATGIDWFVYDGALEVSNRDETATRFVPLKGLGVDDAARVLQQAGLDTAQVDITEIADGLAVKVSGPPKAAEVVEAVFALTKVEDVVPAPENSIVVRRGTVEVVERFGDAGVIQLNEDRKAGPLVSPDFQTTADATAAVESANPPPSE